MLPNRRKAFDGEKSLQRNNHFAASIPIDRNVYFSFYKIINAFKNCKNEKFKN